MDSRFYRRFFGDLPRTRTVCHSYVPCHNLASLDMVKDLSNEFGVEDETESVSSNSDIFPFFQNFGYETDVSTVLYAGSGVVDRATKLVTEKLLWQKKLKMLTPKDPVKAWKYLKLAVKEVPGPNSEVEKYLKHIKSDPEPDFEGDYNWLYTGGNIARFYSSCDQVLITSNEVQDSTVLNFTEVGPDFKGLHAEIMRQRTFCLSENDAVLQICCSNDTDGIAVVSRQRKNITFLRFGDNCGSANWTYKTSNGIFICSDLSSQSSRIATVNSCLETNIFDIETGRKMLLKNAINSPSWAQIMFDDNGNGLYLAGQSSLSMIDLRAGSDTSLIYEPKIVANSCEVICNVIRKRIDNTFLIATSHSLIEVDVRSRKNNQRWTHLMKCPPQFGKTCYRDGEEIVVLQSEDPDELIGIINRNISADFRFAARCSPRVLNNIKREWNKAQLSGVCAHPGIRERLNFSVTGLEIFSDSNDGPYILTVNGGGDVMVNKLKKATGDGNHGEECRDNTEESLIGLKKFEDHCLKTYSEEITADELVDMSCLIEVLEEENMKEKGSFGRREARWNRAEMFSPYSLCYYKDYMSERILGVWNIKMRNFWDEDEKEEENFEESDISKVIQWFDTSEG